jgi:hypothetical protein
MSIRSDIVRISRSDIEPALVAHELAVQLYGMPGHSVRPPKWQSRLARDCICCRSLAGRRDQQTAWRRRGRILILILIFIFGADIRTPWFLLA